MKLDAGDLVLVPFPFTDLTAAKSRPALVLSVRAYNDTAKDVILCGVTSNLANAAHSVLLDGSALAEGTLPRPSRVKVDKVVTLAQSLVRKRVARIDAVTMAMVMREFESLFP